MTYDMRPRRQRKPLDRVVILALAGIALITVIAAGIVFWAVGYGGPTSAAPTTSASATGSEFTEEMACIKLVPILDDAATEVTALAQQPDGTTVEWMRVSDALYSLRQLRDKVPSNMRADLASQIDPLDRMWSIHNGAGNGTLDLAAFRDSGVRLLERCKAYANS